MIIMRQLALVVLTVVIARCDCFFFSSDEEPEWNGLEVTWGNPFSSHTYSDVPRTVEEALEDGWVKISDCDLNATWRGNRYIKDNDYAATLLFDVNGFIAGFQTSLPKGLEFPPINQRPPFLEDGDRYIASTYFVDPKIICTGGRTAEEFQIQGTGTNLYVQNSTIPEDSILIPRSADDMSATKWQKNKCIWTMGVHYYYDVRVEMTRDEFFPMFMIYNKGRLNVFGWAYMANLETSPRFEHPTSDVFHQFMDPLPPSFLDAKTATTFHVYLTPRGWTNRC